MTNKQFQELLKDYPDNMPIKLFVNPDNYKHGDGQKGIIEFTDENILVTSENAWIDDEADPETWDCEDGKIRHKGKRYLLLNPIIT